MAFYVDLGGVLIEDLMDLFPNDVPVLFDWGLDEGEEEDDDFPGPPIDPVGRKRGVVVQYDPRKGYGFIEVTGDALPLGGNNNNKINRSSSNSSDATKDESGEDGEEEDGEKERQRQQQKKQQEEKEKGMRVFVHWENIRMKGRAYLIPGMEVEFKIEQTRKGPAALQVTGLGGRSCDPEMYLLSLHSQSMQAQTPEEAEYGFVRVGDPWEEEAFRLMGNLWGRDIAYLIYSYVGRVEHIPPVDTIGPVWPITALALLSRPLSASKKAEEQKEKQQQKKEKQKQQQQQQQSRWKPQDHEDWTLVEGELERGIIQTYKAGTLNLAPPSESAVMQSITAELGVPSLFSFEELRWQDYEYNTEEVESLLALPLRQPSMTTDQMADAKTASEMETPAPIQACPPPTDLVELLAMAVRAVAGDSTAFSEELLSSTASTSFAATAAASVYPSSSSSSSSSAAGAVVSTSSSSPPSSLLPSSSSSSSSPFTNSETRAATSEQKTRRNFAESCCSSGSAAASQQHRIFSFAPLSEVLARCKGTANAEAAAEEEEEGGEGRSVEDILAIAAKAVAPRTEEKVLNPFLSSSSSSGSAESVSPEEKKPHNAGEAAEAAATEAKKEARKEEQTANAAAAQKKKAYSHRILVTASNGSLHSLRANSGVLSRTIVSGVVHAGIRVRKSDGPRSDVGTRSTKLNKPIGIAVAAGGSVFVLDEGCVRGVQKTTGQTISICEVDNSPESATSSGTLRRAESRRTRVQDIHSQESKRKSPTHCCIAARGHLLAIADRNGTRLRLLDLRTGECQVVWTRPEDDRDGGIRSLVFDPQGRLMVLRPSGLRRVDLTTGRVEVAGRAHRGRPGSLPKDGPAHVATFSDPRYLFLDPAGNCFISEGKEGRIRRVDMQTGTVTTLAVRAPLGVFNPKGTLFLTSPSGNSLIKIKNVGQPAPERKRENRRRLKQQQQEQKEKKRGKEEQEGSEEEDEDEEEEEEEGILKVKLPISLQPPELWQAAAGASLPYQQQQEQFYGAFPYPGYLDLSPTSQQQQQQGSSTVFPPSSYVPMDWQDQFLFPPSSASAAAAAATGTTAAAFASPIPALHEFYPFSSYSPPPSSSVAAPGLEDNGATYEVGTGETKKKSSDTASQQPQQQQQQPQTEQKEREEKHQQSQQQKKSTFKLSPTAAEFVPSFSLELIDENGAAFGFSGAFDSAPANVGPGFSFSSSSSPFPSSSSLLSTSAATSSELVVSSSSFSPTSTSTTSCLTTSLTPTNSSCVSTTTTASSALSLSSSPPPSSAISLSLSSSSSSSSPPDLLSLPAQTLCSFRAGLTKGSECLLIANRSKLDPKVRALLKKEKERARKEGSKLATAATEEEEEEEEEGEEEDEREEREEGEEEELNQRWACPKCGRLHSGSSNNSDDNKSSSSSRSISRKKRENAEAISLAPVFVKAKCIAIRKNPFNLFEEELLMECSGQQVWTEWVPRKSSRIFPLPDSTKGCFFPGSKVDFKHPEKSRWMDATVLEAHLDLKKLLLRPEGGPIPVDPTDSEYHISHRTVMEVMKQHAKNDLWVKQADRKLLKPHGTKDHLKRVNFSRLAQLVQKKDPLPAIQLPL